MNKIYLWYKYLIRQSDIHLKSSQKTYLEHLLFALSLAVKCVHIAFILSIHAIIPGIFQNLGSSMIIEMQNDLKNTDS